MCVTETVSKSLFFLSSKGSESLFRCWAFGLAWQKVLCEIESRSNKAAKSSQIGISGTMEFLNIPKKSESYTYAWWDFVFACLYKLNSYLRTYAVKNPSGKCFHLKDSRFVLYTNFNLFVFLNSLRKDALRQIEMLWVSHTQKRDESLSTPCHHYLLRCQTHQRKRENKRRL